MKISASDLKKHIRLTGLSLPGGVSANWEYTTSERDAASTLLTYLEGKRVLYHPFTTRCPSRVVISVLQVRKRIQIAMESLDRASYMHNLLGNMRSSTIRFLDSVTANCSEDVSCNDCRVQHTGCLTELNIFREEMGSAIAALCVSFDLEVEEQLASIMPLTGGKDAPVKIRVYRSIDERKRQYSMKQGVTISDGSGTTINASHSPQWED